MHDWYVESEAYQAQLLAFGEGPVMERALALRDLAPAPCCMMPMPFQKSATIMCLSATSEP